MDLRLLVRLAVIALLASSCFEPSVRDGVVSCGSGDSCPPDFRCNSADQLCYRTLPGSESDAALVDASILDGGPDAASADAASAIDAPVSTIDASTAAACSDGVDNDCDGRVDFPADPGCSDALASSEHGVKACDDGMDNDQDGFIDFHLPGSSCGVSDPQCFGPDDPKED